MQVLITGGAGFIGLQLVQYHINKGDMVFILDNLYKSGLKEDIEYRELLKDSNVQFISIDLSKKISNINISNHLDCVYHLAAINGTKLFYEIPYEVSRVNLLTTINLLDWLENKSIGRIIYASTSEVYAGAVNYNLVKFPTSEDVPVVFDQPTHPRFSYATSKFMGEFLFFHYGKKFNTEITVLRYHNIYGPRMGNKHVIPELIMRLNNNENPLKLYGGTETRSFCYIFDAIEATYQVAQSPRCIGEIIHIGNSKEEIRIINLTNKLISLMGLDIRIENTSGPEASVIRRCPDTSKLKKLTGFESQINLDEGLMQTINWYLHKNY